MTSEGIEATRITHNSSIKILDLAWSWKYKLVKELQSAGFDVNA